MVPNDEKISFKAHYEYLIKGASELRERICRELNITRRTFYNKLSNNSFSNPEKLIIAQIMQKPVNELFPEINS